MQIYGISSKIPFSSSMHYLLFDLDNCSRIQFLIFEKWLHMHVKGSMKHNYMEKTPNGYHVFIWLPYHFQEICEIHRKAIYIDDSWAKIGQARGYWFLWCRNFIHPPVPTQFMKIEVPEGNKWLSSKKC